MRSSDDYEIKIKQIEFQMFCDVRKWTFQKIEHNRRNRKQFLCYCFDEQGTNQYFLISESGNYYQYVGPKKWEMVDYVYKESEGN